LSVSLCSRAACHQSGESRAQSHDFKSIDRWSHHFLSFSPLALIIDIEKEAANMNTASSSFD
jgi:hypothetical protein